MTFRNQTRLKVEQLDDRSLPSVTASVVQGSLVVVGDPAAASNLTITASDTNADQIADTFKVVDGATTVGTFSGITGNVILRLSKNDDTVAIDLGGLSTSGSIRANLGDGTNSFTLTDGAVKGQLSVEGGSGTDTVTLGGATALTINGNAHINLRDGASDALELMSQATIKGNLQAFSANLLTLDAGSTVGKSAIIRGGSGGNTVNLNGAVNRNVDFLGSNQADTLNVTGTVGGNLLAFLRGGDDTATVSGTVKGNVILNGGAGNDTLTISGTVGKHTIVIGGRGDDKVTIAATAHLAGRAHIYLGKGNDTLTLDDAATISTLKANGGPGIDTFIGTSTRTGLTLLNFEA